MSHLSSSRLSTQVIVGVNGSGKSTILKLISRIYDPSEGTIFIDDKDIKTLKLADLRRAMSILFQDYSYFPLSVSFQFPLLPVPYALYRLKKTLLSETPTSRLMTRKYAKQPA